jgi:hypothetical protein
LLRYGFERIGEEAGSDFDLLGSKGLHGIDRSCATGGNNTGDDCGYEQDERNGCEYGEVNFSDSEECALHSAPDEISANEA